MTTIRIETDACPVPECGQHPDVVIITTDGTKLTTQNMTQERTCLLPTTLYFCPECRAPRRRRTPPSEEYECPECEWRGASSKLESQAASYIVMHGALEKLSQQSEKEVVEDDPDGNDDDDEDTEQVDDEQEEPEPADDPDESAEDPGGPGAPDDLEGDHYAVFAVVEERTARSGGAVKPAGISAHSLGIGRDISPDDAEAIARELVDEGYLEEPFDNCFAVP